jgi:hypothetical protein
MNRLLIASLGDIYGRRQKSQKNWAGILDIMPHICVTQSTQPAPTEDRRFSTQKKNL